MLDLSKELDNQHIWECLQYCERISWMNQCENKTTATRDSYLIEWIKNLYLLCIDIILVHNQHLFLLYYMAISLYEVLIIATTFNSSFTFIWTLTLGDDYTISLCTSCNLWLDWSKLVSATLQIHTCSLSTLLFITRNIQ